MYAKLKNKLNIKGSILVATLLIMGLMLVIAMGIASITIQEKKSANVGGQSTKAFQVADSGVEAVIGKIKQDTTGTDPINNSIGTCNDDNTITTNVAGGTAKITFFDGSGNTLDCGIDKLSAVRKVKSVGSYASASRAIEAAVAAPGSPVGTCYNDEDILFIQFASSLPAGFDGQCSYNDLIEAGNKGCLPIIGQYFDGISGCVSGIGGAGSRNMTLAGKNGLWDIEYSTGGTMFGPCTGTIKAYCKKGIN